MKTLLIYPPFCTPATPPYSITNIDAFLKANLPKEHSSELFDANIFFHTLKFSSFKKSFQKINLNLYDEIADRFIKKSGKTYAENNALVVDGTIPEFFEDVLHEILRRKPDICAFSLVFSSQCFYAYALIKELKKHNIITIIGGPAVNEKVSALADETQANELELLNYIVKKPIPHQKLNMSYAPDFSQFLQNKDYFTPELVISIRTSSSCYYRKCAFCTHFNPKSVYYEYPISHIKKIVVQSKAKYFFFTDDMIHKKRLLELAKMLQPLNVRWMCQLKPTADLDKDTLQILYNCGLRQVLFGVESGNQRVLDLMQKGIVIHDVERVLKNSHDIGIKNIVYIMFGFPTETKDEFLDTIAFLKRNDEVIDLVSTSVFGLQKGSAVYNNPSKYGVTKIIETKRTILEPSIAYEVLTGLTHKEAIKLRGNYKRTFEKINKYPKMMNYFREHLLTLQTE